MDEIEPDIVHGQRRSISSLESGDETSPVSNGPNEDGSTPPTKYWTKKKVFSLVNFTFANFCVGALYSLLGPFFPQEAANKGATSTEIGLVFGCFELIIIISTPFFGIHLTRIGAKFTYVAGIFISGSCAILFGFLDQVPSGNMFVGMCFAVRSIEALGTSAYVTASMAIIANTFPEKATSMVGTLELFSGLGLMVAPPLGGFLYELGGFRLPFLVCGSFMLFVAFLSAIILPNQDMPVPEQKGSMLRLLRIPIVIIMMGFVAAGSISIGFIDVALAVRLQDIYHFKPLMIGVCFLVGPGLYTLCAPVFGHVADKVSNNVILLMVGLGYTINFAGFVIMGPAPFLGLPDDMLWLIIIAQAAMGMGVGTMVMTFRVVNCAAVEAGFEENLDTFGLVSGLFNTFFSVGALVGPIGGGYLVDAVTFEWAAFIAGSFSICLVLVLAVHVIYLKVTLPPERHLTSVIEVDPQINERTALLTNSTISS